MATPAARLVLCGLCFAALGWEWRLAAQQRPEPHIGYVYPAGGRQGSSFTAKLGGQFLDGVTNAYLSGTGITARVLGHTKPLTPAQANALRERQKELMQKRAASVRGRRSEGTNLVWTAADAKALEEIRVKLATFQRRPPNPSIAEVVTLEVSAAPGAEPGRHELRLRTPQGLSNPLTFLIGQLPEIGKVQPEPRRDFAQRGLRNAGEGKAVPGSEMSISIPAVVNGQILQGGVDRYRFRARAGQKLVVVVNARELIPYIADAVPGWFQATLTLLDSKGKELAYSDDFRFRPDPVLYFEVAKDGEYAVEIKDAIYRGREDFVYRISIAESPFVTGIFPLGGPAGKATELTLQGWNLPTATVTEHDSVMPGLGHVSVAGDKFRSNLLPFAVDTLPETFEEEPNDTAAQAQAVTLPIIINGRIQRPGDWDVFKFVGRAGQQIVAEVYARRLDSPLDSVIKLTDASGRQLAFNDDHEDKASGLNTHHADSYFLAGLTNEGTHYVHLGDPQRQGGEAFSYRLRLSEPRPDFELRVVPSSVNIRAGMNAPITVYALRKDGFTNEITLSLDEAPAGFGLSGARVPAGQDQVRLTLSGTPQPEPMNISLEGYAFINGQRVARHAVPADDMMQAFAYRHLVPAQELKVSVGGRFGGRGGIRLIGAGPVKIPAGGTATVTVAAPLLALANRVDLELSDPPEGITIQRVTQVDRGSQILFHADGQKLHPGVKGNLIVNVVSGAVPGAKAKKQAAARRVTVGVLPAIPFEVVAGD